MVYRLIKDGMDGDISVSNEEFIIDNKVFYGAKFIIQIPIK
jgi:hypothetical protein